MLSQRKRAVVWAGAALVGVWILAVAGYRISSSFKVTAEKVAAYVESLDLSKLSPAERAKALQKLADKINALSLEERQRLRADRAGYRWFSQMTEEEKGAFIEATMPTGFKQMLTAFDQLPEDKRRVVISDALRRMRGARSRGEVGPVAMGEGTNALPITDELQAKGRALDLKSFYSQSSAQTKAELAPVLEELQRAMESGRAFRGR